MAAPYSAGSIFVSVVPSFKNNQNDIAREMKRQGREGAKAFGDEFGEKLGKELGKQTEQAARQNKQSTERAAKTQGEQYSSAFRKSLGDGLKDAGRQLDRLAEGGGKGLRIPVDVDEKAFRNQFNALVRDVALTEADIKVGADVDGAIHDVDRLIGQLRRLRDASTNPEVRTDMSAALGSMEDSIARARKNAQLEPEGPPETPSRQLGTFDATARNRVQSALASVPPVDVDADTTPAMRKIIEFRTDAFNLLDDLQADVKLDGDDTIARMRALMTTLEGVIETADPELEVDTSYDAAGALAQIKGWVNAVSPVEVPIEPEMGFFRTRLAQAAKAAGEALPEVRIDADATDAQKKMAEIRAELMTLSGEVRVGMDLDEARAKSRELQLELGALRKNNVEIEVDVDAARAIIELEAVERAAREADRELNRSSRGADTGANSFRAFSGRVLGVAALGPVAIPVIGALGVAVGAVAPLAVAGGIGLGVFALAVHGVMDAVGAMQDVQDNAAKDAKNYADGVRNASRSLRDAERSLADARRSAADGSVQSQQRVKDAIERVSDAEDDYADANAAAQRAQERLTAAREEYSQRLIDLQMNIRGGALAERRAYMQLAEAEVAYANAMADPGATRTEREQLLLDLDEQKFRLDEVLLSNKRLGDQQADTNAKGVEGSDEVVSAQSDVADANERVADAQDSLADAVAAVAQAQADQQRAAADSARTIEDAQLRLADAQADYADAVGKTSTSQDKLAQSMAKLSPAGRDFAEYLFSLKPYLSDLQSIAAEGILPGVQGWMSSIIDTYGPQFSATVGGMSDAIGGMFTGWAEELQTPVWAEFFDMMESKGPVFLSQMGEVLTNVGTGVAALITAFAPAAEDFGNGMVGFSEDFKNWATGLSETQGFKDFMDWWARVGPEVLEFFGALAGAIGNIAIALAPYGEDLMQVFTAILDWVGGLDPDVLGAVALAIVGIVIAFQALVGLNALIAGFTAIWTLGAAAMAVFEGTAIGFTAVLTGIAGIVAIVVAAVVLLVLGFYLLYQNSETFRDLVDAAWQGIKDAVAFVVDWFQREAMPIIETVLQAIGDFFTWLWHDIIEPIFGVWQVAWGVLWDFLLAMWDNVGKPMFDLIGSIAKDLWEIIGPILQLIGLAFEFLWSTLVALWDTVGKPIFDAFIDIITWLWEKVIGPVLQYIAEAFGVMFDIIESAWNAVGKPVLDLFQAIVEGLVDVFQGSFDGIQAIWDALLDVLMAPIVLVVDTVLNKGLIAGVNKLASVFTSDDEWITPLDTSWIPGRATGGPIPGTSPNKRADNVLIRATAGEFMQQVDAVDYYGVDLMDALNQRMIPKDALLAGLQGRAYGGMIDPMWAAVSKRFPQARLTSGYRPGDTGLHGKKMAIDVAGSKPYPDPAGVRQMLEMNQWLAHTFPNLSELIHTSPGAINLKNGKPHTYNEKTRNDHKNHNHVGATSMDALGGGTAGEGGDSWWQKAWDFISHPIDFLKNLVTSAAGDTLNNDFGQMLLNVPMDLASNIADPLLDFIGGIGDSVAGFFGLGGDDLEGRALTGNVRQIVQGVAANYGWDTGWEWSALSTLIGKESSWNPTAQNPTSTAYGLGQFLNSTWATVGGSKTSDPAKQAEYLMRYISGKYGTPSGALSFHNKNNWYADGGLIGDPLAGVVPTLFDTGGRLDPGLHLIENATRHPEAILNPTQLENIERIADGGGRGPLIGSLTVPYAGQDPYEVIEEIDHWATVADRGGKYGG